MVAMPVTVRYFCYRLDQSVKRPSRFAGEETAFLNPGVQTNNNDLENLADMSDFQVRLLGLYVLFINFP